MKWFILFMSGVFAGFAITEAMAVPDALQEPSVYTERELEGLKVTLRRRVDPRLLQQAGGGESFTLAYYEWDVEYNANVPVSAVRETLQRLRSEYSGVHRNLSVKPFSAEKLGDN